MKVNGKVAVVTGGGHGIGKALCLRFAAEGARAVVVADLDGDASRAVAAGIGGMSVTCDVARETDVAALVETATQAYGQVDLMCSNAGIFTPGGIYAPDSDWELIFSINFKAHLYAARAVLPQMVARGEGYLLQTVSAAGLLTQVGSALYAVTKHSALALAEWIAMEYGDRGIKVSCVCPQGVRTRMLLGLEGEKESFLKEGSVSPDEVAGAVIAGLDIEKFLILPHPEVATYFERKASDYDRWLGGMRRLKAKVEG